MNKQEKFILAETCANKISVLAEKQDKLFEKLKLELGVDASDEYFIDSLFDYCFNNGEYSSKLLKRLLDKSSNECM
tara:strand:- start:208 stop:435 length:228 start_codon:yes stop_codon:yes gene_type:complete